MKRKKRLRAILLVLFIVPLLTMGLFNVGVYFSRSLNIHHPYEIEVLDRTGESQYKRLFYGYGEYLPTERINDYMEMCVIMSEDQHFYSHWGFDYPRIVSSFFQNLFSSGIVSGGSTITQQLARTIYLNNDKTYSRKINEAFITRKLEMMYSKHEILEAYLNSAYFGHNIYGIDEASYFFFAKSPIDLTLAECALLTGILSSPNNYSPANSYENAIIKQRQVLKKLLKAKKISQLEHDTAYDQPLNFTFNKKNHDNSHLLYYHDAMKTELTDLGINTLDNQRIGLKVQSTLDMDVMNKISSIVNSYHIDNSKQEIGVVVMKPNSGDVLGLIGGVNYEDSQFNRAINSQRQTGSSIKPLLYYLALENNLTPLTEMISEPTDFYIKDVGKYSPSNANDKYANGPITMLEALAVSDNIYATKTTLLLGSQTLKNALVAFGVKDAVANPTIGLGTNEMTPLTLASIYNTFASEGKYYEPKLIKSAYVGSELVYRTNNAYRFSLDRDNTLILNYMLRAPFDKNLSTFATPSLANYQTKNRFAGKTGTTDTDSWVVGFNPNYTIAVYMGTDGNEPLESGNLTKQIFVDIADALTHRDGDVFFSPSNKMKPFCMRNNVTNKLSNTYYHL